MAKVIITYEINIEEADDIALQLRLAKVNQMAMALFQIRYNLRKKLEWIEESKPDADIIQAFSEHLTIIFDELGITEDLLI